MQDITPEWILTKTGIHRRHVASESDSASSLAVSAALKAIEKAGIEVNQIGLIIAATFSPDYMFPPVLAKIQKELKAQMHKSSTSIPIVLASSRP